MDLIGILKEEVEKNSISLISQKTGESEEKTKAGIFATIPAVLAGIMKNGASGGTGFLKDLIPGYSADEPSIMPDRDLQDGDSLMNRGKSMLGNLFGSETESVSNAVSESSGIDRQKSSGLVAMAIPVIMGAVSRLMGRNGWNFSDLLGKLFESKSAIISA
jgi:OmpA-OmpF porin, OOP family